MRHSLSFNGLHTNVGTIVLQPVIVNRSKTFSAFTAKVMFWELDVRPSISCKGDVADLSSLVERGQRQETHLILLGLVLISFNLLTPIIVIDEVPCGDGFVVQHFDLNCISGIASPSWGSLCMG
jgi:hypothetical protein